MEHTKILKMKEPETKDRVYAAIDLKSFYASVECAERGLDPLQTNLVVADTSRTEKTICLAVSPSLKAYKIPGRARLFEVNQKVKEINQERLSKLRSQSSGYYDKMLSFRGKSADAAELSKHPELELDFYAAVPRMSLYMQYSARIYNIYLKYVAAEDIHVYSIDEVFLDLTDYLKLYRMNAHDLTRKIIRDILQETKITATAGIAPNLFLCKVAMDIVAKHIPADEDGVRIAELDLLSYRELLWDHQPLTDFWRIGKGYAKKLQEHGLFTMGDICRCSLGGPNDLYNEDYLFKLFGVNAELLIDHAWGYESCTIRDIKAYKPENNSLGCGQVLQCPYDYEKGRLIVREMADSLALDLVGKNLAADQIALTINYDADSLKNGKYSGEVKADYYGRSVPKHAHGSCSMTRFTSSSRMIMEAALSIYDKNVDPKLLIRRVEIAANHVVTEQEAKKLENEKQQFVQLDFFTDYNAENERRQKESAELEKEKKLQLAALKIKEKFGKNAILKGMNLEEGANTRQRNQQIGGHKA